MHILIIPSWYSNDINKTNGSFFREQAIALKEHGYQVSLIYPEILTLKEYIKRNTLGNIRFLDDNGVNTYSKVAWKIPKSGVIGYNYIFRSTMKKLYKNVVENHGKPDIIHAHSSVWAGYNAMKLSKEENIPLVITEHSSILSSGILTKYEKVLVKKEFTYANKIISVSNSLKNELNKYINNKDIEVIPNMVDMMNFSEKIKYNKKDKKFRFLTVSYLRKIKRVDIIIKAFATKFKGKNIELYIGGDGEAKNYLKQLCIKLGVENQVVFLGALSRKHVNYYMNFCDVFVLSSEYETFGVVLIEALSCGKPIVSTKCGGPNDIINNQNGILVKCNDINSFGEAMQFIKSNYNKYNKNFIKEDCYKRFSKQSVLKQLDKIYESIR